jgi:hypothetical protein
MGVMRESDRKEGVRGIYPHLLTFLGKVVKVNDVS